MKWWRILAAMTVLNVGWDLIFGSLGELTFVWQAGVMAACAVVWKSSLSSTH